jgi:redox-sensitive bicupin YhaK (pirin superfamily)
VHFLQIWITPKADGIQPSYEERNFLPEEKRNRLRLIVSPTGEEGSLSINQDAKIYSSLLEAGKETSHAFQPGRYGWVQVVKGSLELNGKLLSEGDGAAISDEKKLDLVAKKPSEVLLFDLA